MCFPGFTVPDPIKITWQRRMFDQMLLRELIRRAEAAHDLIKPKRRFIAWLTKQ